MHIPFNPAIPLLEMYSYRHRKAVCARMLVAAFVAEMGPRLPQIPAPLVSLLGCLISRGRLPSQDYISQQPLHPGGAMYDQLQSLCCTG